MQLMACQAAAYDMIHLKRKSQLHDLSYGKIRSVPSCLLSELATVETCIAKLLRLRFRLGNSVRVRQQCYYPWKQRQPVEKQDVRTS
jgi:hypothetical protein